MYCGSVYAAYKGSRNTFMVKFGDLFGESFKIVEKSYVLGCELWL